MPRQHGQALKGGLKIGVPNPALSTFLARLASSFEEASFVKLTLGHPANAQATLRKLLLRPVVIRGKDLCCVVSRFTTRDETKNYPFEETVALVAAKLGSEFLSANLFTETEELQLELGGTGGKPRLRTIKKERPPAPLEHDRAKPRWVDADAPFLMELGVTDSRGKVRERMGDKFRQIERFVDLLASAFRETDLPSRAAAPDARPVTLCDMGAGKGYLTFAAADFFQRIAKVPTDVTGVETRADLVTLCNRVAQHCGFSHFRFVKSSIEAFRLPALDILVALHACDTATDDALAAGIRAGAEIILAAPCCQKELRPQLTASGPLRDVLRHGLFAERHSEMATDALRALLLEQAGYRVRVAEFVAAEHTAKNVMLIATLRRAPLSTAAVEEIRQRIADLKTFYGIQHHRLEQLLLEGCQLGCPPSPAGAVPPV